MPLRAVALTPRLLAACFNGLSKSDASISLVSTSGLPLLLLSSPAFRRGKTLPETQKSGAVILERETEQFCETSALQERLSARRGGFSMIICSPETAKDRSRGQFRAPQGPLQLGKFSTGLCLFGGCQ